YHVDILSPAGLDPLERLQNNSLHRLTAEPTIMTCPKLALALLALLTLALPLQAAEKAQPIFNGKDLTGWEGNPDIWSVEDGAITGRTTADKPIDDNTFLIWKDG